MKLDSSLTFENLGDDLHLYTIGFLNTEDVWSFSWTCRHIRNCVVESKLLCSQLGHQHFSFVQEEGEVFCAQWWQKNENKDNNKNNDNEKKNEKSLVNNVFLWRLAARCWPSELDQDIFSPASCQVGRTRRTTTTTTTALSSRPAFTIQEDAIFYMGSVGPENHCVRSTDAFPRPIKSRISLEHTQLRPFTVPTRLEGGRLDMTPRLFCYYEVSVLPGPFLEGRDCVAIGLSNRKFFRYLHRHMPGWDSHSYGYHGDDGGLYHRSGLMRWRQHFPTFGQGDTVGCGLDYARSAIFFTLNGNWLGYAWVNAKALSDSTMEWSPTIGIDTKCGVRVNFGESPFRYDIGGLHERDATVVQAGGELLEEPLLAPEAYMKQLTLMDGYTKKYSKFDTNGMPTHWFDGDPLRNYQENMAANEFKRQKRKYDEYMALSER